VGAPDFVILSDAQINENHGAPMFISSLFAQGLVAVARRSVQQTTFADVLLDETARRASPEAKIPIVFLGDALNLSCESELKRYDRVVEQWRDLGGTWFTIPGNHDGFFTGTTEPSSTQRFGGSKDVLQNDYGRDRSVWDWVCNDHIVTKTLSTAATLNPTHNSKVCEKYDGNKKECETGYIESVARRSSSRSDWVSGNDLGKGCFARTNAEGTERILRCGYHEQQPTRPAYQAFLLRKVQLKNEKGAIDLLFLDSSVYLSAPCFVDSHRSCSNAGDAGGLGTEQTQIVSSWIGESRNSGVPVILFAHHPVADWRTSDQKWLASEVVAGGVLTIFTAHVHQGCLRAPFPSLPDFREVNVDSIIDSAGVVPNGDAKPSAFTRVWINWGEKASSLSYKPVAIDDAFLGCSATNPLETEGFDEVKNQIGNGFLDSIGPYKAHLNQIRGEASLLDHVSRNAVPGLAPELPTTNWQRTAEAADGAYQAVQRCASFAREATTLFGKDAVLHCEQEISLPDGNSIQAFSHEKEDELAQADGYFARHDDLYTNPNWLKLITNSVFRQQAACATTHALRDYWKALDKQRKDVRQCVDH